MRVIIVAGEPGTGKSSLFKKFDLGKPNFKYGLVRGHKKGKVLYVGIYEEGHTYPGTDRLSMAVQPHLIELIQRPIDDISAIVFEGDRLCNSSLLKQLAAMKVETQIMFLEVSEELLAKRRKARGDTFKDNWLAGRKTKVENFKKTAVDCLMPIEVVLNENADQQFRNFSRLAAMIYGILPTRDV